MPYFGYLSFRLLVLVISILPFRVLYCVSDCCYVLIYYFVRYRRKVVEQNLENSFPEKSKKELKQIRKKFYRFMTDLIFESIKGLSMTKKQINERHWIENIDLLNELYNRNQSSIGVTSHYGNWEWGAYSGGVQLRHNAIAFYKPMSNKFIDKYIKYRRAKFNCTLASIQRTFDAFENNVKRNSVFIMAADQSPTNLTECYWIEFLHQDTACLHGPEKYAHMYNLPVYYIHIRRQKRGYYTLHISLLSENPVCLKSGELTKMYMRTLESHIIEQPEYWLWSHKRWKRKRNSIN